MQGFLTMDPQRNLILISVLFFSFLVSLTHSQSVLPGNHLVLPSNRPKLVRQDDTLYCQSFRLAVEANNAGAWGLPPARCFPYVHAYRTSESFSSDINVVAGYSLEFAKSVNISDDRKDAWVFDVDDTLLSLFPWFESHVFGAQEVFDIKSLERWISQGKAPALQANLRLYNEIQQLGFKIFLLTGRSESIRNITQQNLQRVGYHYWDRLILRGPSDVRKSATEYKSEKRKELQDAGYRIRGSSGDQWTDLLGYAVAERSFKVPNPLYYVP